MIVEEKRDQIAAVAKSNSTAAEHPQVKSNNTHKFERIFLLLVLLLFGCSLFYIGKLDVPIYDDWTYAWSVQNLISTGKLHYLACFAGHIPGIIIAAVICNLFGFSFSTLHIITAGFAVLMCVGFYRCILELKQSPLIASSATLLLLFNPLVLILSTTFMTDIPFLCFMVWGFWSLLKMLKSERSLKYAFFGSLALCLAITTRQIGIALLPAYLLAGFFLWKRNKKTAIAAMTLFLLPPTIGYLATNQILQNASQYPNDYLRISVAATDTINSWFRRPETCFGAIADYFPQVMCYLGLFTLPIGICLTTGSISKAIRALLCSTKETEPSTSMDPKATRQALMFSMLIIGLPLILQVVLQDRFLPFYPQLFCSLLPGQYAQLSNLPVSAPEHMRLLTVLSALNATVVITVCWVSIFRLFKNEPGLDHVAICDQNLLAQAPPKRQFLICVALSFSILTAIAVLQGAITPADRYLLALVPPFLILLFGGSFSIFANRTSIVVLLTACLLFSAYSVVGARDWAEFTRARWTCIDAMESRGITVFDMDAGPEYIYMRASSIYEHCNPPSDPHTWSKDMRGENERAELRFWPVLGETFIVNPQALNGYHAIFTVPFRSQLRNADLNMSVWQRN
ncbi:MAG: glycosyltransferase family 39 protein [Candidatus Obscuribacterales bacterium]|jgi:4-amino-4-deoxy-L-arabinose transferase-like glycosyltransferase|nr:glycosyltransferase family 39 protein [Candidatus Obscuribacterales bacterium]